MTDAARSVSFEVPGKAVPAPRANTRSGQGGYYADPRYDYWKQQVQAAALNAVGGVRPHHANRVALHVAIGRERTIVDVRFEDTKAEGQADVDNLAKGIMDALQGILYRNDRQVMYLSAEKGADV